MKCRKCKANVPLCVTDPGRDGSRYSATEAALGLDLAESVTLGQVLLETHAFRHVADTHDFFYTHCFYRFQPEVRS